MIFLLLVLIPSVDGGCCFPKQWEGRTFQTLSWLMNNGTLIYKETTSRVSFDFTRELTFYNQSIITNMGLPVERVVIQDFSQNKEYTIQDGKCATSDQLTLLQQECSPPGPPMISNQHYGAGASAIPVSLYKYMDIVGAHFHYTVADDGCIPITAEITMPNWTEQGSYTKITYYMDITQGIKDQSIFNIPDICKNTEKEINPDHKDLLL